VKNSSFIVSSTQHAFIVAVRPYLAQHGITDAKTGGLIPFAAFTLAAKSARVVAVFTVSLNCLQPIRNSPLPK
jgi:hypothetical protein